MPHKPSHTRQPTLCPKTSQTEPTPSPICSTETMQPNNHHSSPKTQQLISPTHHSRPLKSYIRRGEDQLTKWRRKEEESRLHRGDSLGWDPLPIAAAQNGNQAASNHRESREEQGLDHHHLTAALFHATGELLHGRSFNNQLLSSTEPATDVKKEMKCLDG